MYMNCSMYAVVYMSLCECFRCCTIIIYCSSYNQLIKRKNINNYSTNSKAT